MNLIETSVLYLRVSASKDRS